MKTRILLALSLAALSVSAAAKPVPDFALLDHQGKFYQLSYFGDQRAVVIAAHQLGEPEAAARLQALQVKFADQDVVAFLLNPGLDGRDDIAADAARHGLTLPVLVDETQLVAASLGFERVGQVLLIDGKTRAVRYQGSLHDIDALDGALTAMLAGQAELGEAVAAVGAQIEYRPQIDPNAVSYSNDIVPILKDNCVNCHHDGGIGPWSMSSHSMVQGWSAMMREVLMTRRMPPGQIDTHASKEIDGVAGLSVAEMQQLVHWIDAGAPQDGALDPLTELTFTNPKFSLGEPDLIYKVAPQSIPATGVIDYRYIPVELNLDRDVWVRAMEFVPGDEEVLHHVIAYVSSPADKTVRGRQTGAARGESVGGFAPGRQPDQFRDNSGRLLKKGSNLLLQMHYTTSGKATVDETEVGIYIYDKPPQYVMSGGVAGQRRFLVPPHAKEHKLEGEQLVERDAYLYQMTPHMHFRGKYMSYTAEYPDGTSELLLSVPNYNFNWQFSYPLKEPLFLPAGTRLVARGAMDNSDRNPANPDPTKPVHFGLQTKHEMFFGFTTLRYLGETPASVLGTDQDADATPVTGGD